MKKLFLAFTFIGSLKVLAVDICVMTTKPGDPFTTAKQDCTQIQGGAGNIATKPTADHLLFLYNNGFSIISVSNISTSATDTMMVYTLKRD
jgi:hypothetical protein